MGLGKEAVYEKWLGSREEEMDEVRGPLFYNNRYR
jgi:hypothetical protein